jgi:ABC-2 type transport system permease protein
VLADGCRVSVGIVARGRGPPLLFAFTCCSAFTYLAATNQAINFLGAGGGQPDAADRGRGRRPVTLLSRDGISGERERGTLESLLLTPVSRRALVVGKLAAALTVWFATFVVSTPYIWVLGLRVGRPVLLLSLGVGTVLAVGLAAPALVSALSASNKVSIAVSWFILLALFAPTQLPGGLPKGWFGDVLARSTRSVPACTYSTAILVTGRSDPTPPT